MRPKVKSFTSKMRILPFPPNPKHTMKVKVATPLILGACLALIGTASADTITWTGAPGNGVSLFETNNWDNPGGVITVSNFKDVAVAHDFVVNDGAATVGGTGGVNGTFDLGGTGSITVNSGAFKLGAGAIIKDGTATFSNTTGSNSQLQGTFDNLDAFSNWGTNLIGGLDLINGSTFSTRWFSGGNGVSTLNGGSVLTIREDGSGTFNNNTVNFLDLNSTIVYSNAGRTIAEVTSEHLSKFTVNGDAAVVGTNINIFTNGDGFTTVQAVPEPQTFALLGGLVALTSVMLRRRTR